MKKTIYIIILCILSTIHASGQNYTTTYDMHISNRSSMKSAIESARTELVCQNINNALIIYSKVIEYQKSNRNQGTQVDPQILAEYSYALAIAHVQDEALKNIDMAIALSTDAKDLSFYISNILILCGYEDLSQPFLHVSKAPSWIKDHSNVILEKYKSPSVINIGTTQSAIQTISSYINDNRIIEALVYSRQLIIENPQKPSGYLLLSTAWEKIKCYTQSLDAYEKGLGFMNMSSSEVSDFSKQLESLRKKSQSKGDSFGSSNIMSMVYGGVGYSASSFIMSGRYGISSGNLSFSADIRLTIPSKGKVYEYFGAGVYYRYRKLFMGMGLGLLDGTFSMSPTFGLSFINKKQTSSFDISLNLTQQFSNGATPSVSISIGKTFYFNFKK